MDPTGTGALPNDMGIGWVSNWLRGAKSANPMASARTGQGQIATGGQIVARSECFKQILGLKWGCF